MSTNESVKSFDEEARRHLVRVRELRRLAWVDTDLDPLERAVLALTGSKERLTEYQKQVTKIRQLKGEPVIQVVHWEGATKRGKVINALGGIISGEVFVASSDYQRSERGTYSGHMLLRVGVSRLVVMENSHCHIDAADPPTIEVGLLVNNESENHGLDPDDDFEEYSGKGQEGLTLIGREDIYNNELFAAGLHTIMLAIEKQRVPAKVQLTS